MRTFFTVLGALVLVYFLFGIYLALVIRWGDERTIGLGYYGRSPRERERFKRVLGIHAAILAPFLRLAAWTSKLDLRRARIHYRGTSAPSGSCSAETFSSAESYEPRPEDIFVVTQMKCGTTWMQHVVYEVLLRGNGNLVESGTALYAVSPWIEGRKSVSMAEAPLIGTERPSRIVKTHLPASLCPFHRRARYIYVARHPASCFASCVDFVVTNAGGMEPGMDAFEEWFRSPELMWWGTWTDHVRGWWDRAQESDNVLFVLFEDMKKDLPDIVRKVTAFLDIRPLTETELGRVVEKCSFAYMQKHQEAFEMHPPHVLQSRAELFVSGSANRHLDVAPEVRQRVMQWAAGELRATTFPLERFYPDVAGADG